MQKKYLVFKYTLQYYITLTSGIRLISIIVMFSAMLFLLYSKLYIQGSLLSLTIIYFTLDYTTPRVKKNILHFIEVSVAFIAIVISGKYQIYFVLSVNIIAILIFIFKTSVVKNNFEFYINAISKDFSTQIKNTFHYTHKTSNIVLYVKIFENFSKIEVKPDHLISIIKFFSDGKHMYNDHHRDKIYACAISNVLMCVHEFDVNNIVTKLIIDSNSHINKIVQFLEVAVEKNLLSSCSNDLVPNILYDCILSSFKIEEFEKCCRAKISRRI